MNFQNYLPKVALFRWRACGAAINASLNNGSWLLEYYDPVSAAKSPAWMPEIAEQIFKQSPPIRVRVAGDQAYIVS